VNVTQILQAIRDQVDDPLSLKHSDAELVRHVNQQVLGMFRTMIRSQVEWSNMTIALKKADALTLFRNTHEWRLPNWVEKVVKVWERRPTDIAAELTLSPYNWTSDPNQIGSELPKSDHHRKAGWTWDGNHAFRVWGGAEPQDYFLHIAALPPPVFRVRVANAHAVPSDTKLYLPATLTTTLPVELGDLTAREEGRYVNAEVEVSDTTSATDLKRGETRRVVYSNAAVNDAGTRRHELTLEFALSSVVAVGDSFETLIPVPEIHTRLLILKVANACAIKMFNTDLQRAIAPEMQQEMAIFADYAQGPRDSSGPFFKTSRESSGQRHDPDRYSRPGILGWWRA
jgi:hypothetical protein